MRKKPRMTGRTDGPDMCVELQRQSDSEEGRARRIGDGHHHAVGCRFESGHTRQFYEDTRRGQGGPEGVQRGSSPQGLRFDSKDRKVQYLLPTGKRRMG